MRLQCFNRLKRKHSNKKTLTKLTRAKRKLPDNFSFFCQGKELAVHYQKVFIEKTLKSADIPVAQPNN